MAAPQRDLDRDLGRLCAAVQKSRLQLRFFRETRRAIVESYAGFHYSEDSADKTQPINLLSMYLGIVGRRLVPKNPRVMLSTFERADKPAVSIMQEWANQAIEEINLAQTLRRAVVDGLLLLGIVKVAIASPADADRANWTLNAGQPFVERIDFDDFAFDLHGSTFNEAGWMAHRVRVPLDLARDFYKDKSLSASEDKAYNLEGDTRIEMLGRGYYSSDEEYEDFVDLWEIYVRRKKLVVTVADDDLTGATNAAKVTADETYGKGRRRALRVQKWVGPDCGPYHLLGFGTVPGNPLPKPPIHDLVDLHKAVNNICRKLIRQAKDTKRVSLVSMGRTEEGKRIAEANDGDMVSVEDPKAVVQIAMNEPSQTLAVLMENLIQRASWLAGNFDLMGGLGPQAKTATQDKLNEAASSANLGSLQDDTLTYVASVLRSWLWFHHHHPTNVHKVAHVIPELPRVSVTRRSFPNNPAVHRNAKGLVVRDHRFEDMHVKVDPYAMQHQTPQSRAQQLLDAVRNVYLPLAQLAQQQGVGLDLNVLFRKLGEYYDDPDFEEIFQFIQKPPEEGGGDGAGVGPTGTAPGSKDPTEIVRRSLGGDGQQAKEALLGNLMSSGSNQNGQVQPMGGK